MVEQGRREVAEMVVSRVRRIALVFRADRRTPGQAVVLPQRLAPIAKALTDVGLTAEPAPWADDMADALRDDLMSVDGILVWVDPVTGAEDRAGLDGVLRELAASGVWVSAHPDVILKMGTKQVLYDTRELGWGSDTSVYRDMAEFTRAFPARLATGGPRVLKQYQGNGGIGVWKVELINGLHRGTSSSAGPGSLVRVQGARARDDATEDVALGEFMGRCEKYFGYSGGAGRLIDQPFQPRINEGMLRCYLVKSEVVGFARQFPEGLSPADLEGGAKPGPLPDRILGLPSAKTMYGPDEPAFQTIKRLLDDEWVPAMQTVIGVDDVSLPALWDADFLFGAKTASGEDTYVLCEINVSSVMPFPDHVPPRLARAVMESIDVARFR
jgi:hypothetical protein